MEYIIIAVLLLQLLVLVIICYTDDTTPDPHMYKYRDQETIIGSTTLYSSYDPSAPNGYD